MQLSTKSLNQHNLRHSESGSSPIDTVVVRIEVTDTGYGITQKDLVKGKLFCGCFGLFVGDVDSDFEACVAAFNQTEQGRQQGGKGTGLGLALVRQIVKLSGGRLGVRSKIGQGSTFWVELRKCW